MIHANPEAIQRGAASPGSRQQFQIVIRSWRALPKNTLRGFANVTVNGLEIDDVTVHERGGEWWISLPARPLIENSQLVVHDGKAQYVSIMRWSDRQRANAFRDAVIQALRHHHPEIFTEAPPQSGEPLRERPGGPLSFAGVTNDNATRRGARLFPQRLARHPDPGEREGAANTGLAKTQPRDR